MRVALLLSGHLRSYEKCAPVLKALVIDPLGITDVFISTWHTIGLSSHIDGNTLTIATNSQLDRIRALYNPTKIEIEPLRMGHGAKYRRYITDNRSADGVSNNLYKVYRSDQLRQSYERLMGIEYDVVIRTRPDVMFRDVLPFDLIEEAATNKRLYLPSFGHFDGLNDQLAFGSGETMRVYAECYNALDGIVSKTVFHPEALLKRYVQDKGLRVSFFDTDYVLERVACEPFEPKMHSPGIPNEFEPVLRAEEAR